MSLPGFRISQLPVFFLKILRQNTFHLDYGIFVQSIGVFGQSVCDSDSISGIFTSTFGAFSLFSVSY